jgi:hypothetical protein
VNVAKKLQNVSHLSLGMAGLIRWSRTRMRAYLESVAMTVHQIHPLNEAAEADADLAMRETTGSTCCCCRPAASRRSFQGIDAC